MERGKSGTKGRIIQDSQPEVTNEIPAQPLSRDTFTHLYRRYVTPIYSYVYSRVGNRDEAEELTGQVFIEALEGLERYEEQGKVAAWLFTIAHLRVVDYYRSHREELPFEEALDSPLDVPTPEARAIQQELLTQLANLVDEAAYASLGGSASAGQAVLIFHWTANPSSGRNVTTLGLGGRQTFQKGFDGGGGGSNWTALRWGDEETLPAGEIAVEVRGAGIVVSGPWEMSWSLPGPVATD